MQSIISRTNMFALSFLALWIITQGENASSFISSSILKSSPYDVTKVPMTSSDFYSSKPSSSWSYDRTDSLGLISSNAILSTVSNETVLSVNLIESVTSSASVTTSFFLGNSVTHIPEFNSINMTSSLGVLPSTSYIVTPSPSNAYSSTNANSSSTLQYSSVTDIESVTAESPSVTKTFSTLLPSSVTSFPSVSMATVTMTTSQPPITTTSPIVKPVIVKPLRRKKELKQGQSLVIECKISTGYPKPSIRWEKDDKPFVDGVPLIIKKVKPHDSGKYKCIASNTGGVDEMTIQLNVLYISDIKLTITKQGSQDVKSVREGETVEITCKVKSFPSPSIKIIKEGKIISSGKTSLGNQEYKTAVTLSNVTRGNDAGMFLCNVSTADFSKESNKDLQIDFLVPPTYPPPKELYRTANSITIPIHKIRYLKNGSPVKYVQIIVLELSSKTMPIREPSSYKDYELAPYKENRSIPYIAGVISVDGRKEFVIGDGERYSMEGRQRRNAKDAKDFYNVPLRSEKYYTAFQRMVAKDSFNALPWIPPIKTVQQPTTHVPDEDHFNVIMGFLIALLVVLIIGVAVAARYYIKMNSHSEQLNEEKFEMNGLGPLGKMARTFSMHVARINENYRPPGPIPMEVFPQHVARMHKSGDMLFSTEYERIRDDHNIPATHCLDPVNQWKNRFTNVVAYDHNRVKLIPYDDEPSTDYINASYIDGYDGMTYIASQGPLKETCGDFWRMIWEQDTRVVVMLTNTRERGRDKCYQYWPTSGSCQFQGAHVSLVKQFEMSSHTIRVFHLSMSDVDESRTITQFHFTSWPDHGVPKSVSFLLSFVREATRENPWDAGPMVVHCSAGVGRTGTFIVIDTMLRQIAQEKTVDVFHYVVQLRKQRNLMVQTEPQYIFIHDALFDAIVSGDTEIRACNIRKRLQELLESTQESDEQTLSNEFRRLTRGVRPRLPVSAANHSSNKLKNRYHNTLPFDDTRVQLAVQAAVAGSDYINASFVDGYKKKRAFIATQAPLPETFSDFWRMIWEQECCTIVTLAQEMENTKLKMDRYWPTSHPITYGYLQVTLIEEEKKEGFDVKHFKITNNQDESSRFVKQFHFMQWTSDDITEYECDLLEMMDDIHIWQQESGHQVITVHCSAGVGRTGVFCAVSSLIERLKAEALVDVFMTVKLLREQRPAMVQTLIQYEYCYKVLLEYINNHESIETQSSPVKMIGIQPPKTPTGSLDSDVEVNHVTSESSDHTEEEREDK